MKGSLLSRARGRSVCCVLCICALLLLILGTCPAFAQGVPNAITYQGRLTNSSGTPLDGNYNLTFKFYDEVGTLLWTSAAIPVTASSGYFTTRIESIPSSVFAGSDVWLETLVGGTVLTPRVKFASVPYALRAGDSLGGWSLTGNSGTVAGTNFLGTTDSLPLELRVSNNRAFLLEPVSRQILIENFYSTNVIGGYHINSVTAGVMGATIGGGGFRVQIPMVSTTNMPNKVTDDYGTVAGGANNTAGDNAGTTSDRPYATVSGGSSNTAGGSYSTIPGGLSNTASGDYSFAAGRQARANHQGSFVWADSTEANFTSTGANQFLIRAAGGVGIGTPYTTHALTVLSATTNTFRLIGSGIYGSEAKLNFGDSNYVYLQEDVDDALTIYSGRTALTGGNIGIGTTNPTRKLQVDSGDALVRGANNFGAAGNIATVYLGDSNNFIRAVNASGVRLGVAGSDLLALTSNNVGIGTTNPSAKLQVDSGNVLVRGTNNFGTAGNEASVFLGDTNNYLKAVNNGGLRFGVWNGIDALSIINGNIGVGTTSPDDKFCVAGTAKIDFGGTNNGDLTGSSLKFGSGNSGEGMASKRTPGGNQNGLDLYTGYSSRLSISNSGNVGIGTTAPAVKLDVHGRLDVRGNVRVMNSSGAILLELGEGLDYAEGFHVTNTDEAGSGTVLVIDADNPGKLAVSVRAYDTGVAGIVAGAKGLGSGVRLGVGGFDRDVALAGRVYCNVDASTAAVKPGDLLTTSNTPGYAMKASDRTRAHGSILGKAMEGLERGQKGQILVLVTLQ